MTDKTISHERVVEAVRVLGIDPKNAHRIEIYTDAVKVHLFVTDPDHGGRVPVLDGDIFYYPTYCVRMDIVNGDPKTTPSRIPRRIRDLGD